MNSDEKASTPYASRSYAADPLLHHAVNVLFVRTALFGRRVRSLDKGQIVADLPKRSDFKLTHYPKR